MWGENLLIFVTTKKATQLNWKSINHENHLSICTIFQGLVVRTIWSCKWLRENSLISYLRNLKRDGVIDAATFLKILPCGSTAGVLCGLPKIHKTGCHFRPIVSSVNTYNWNLASFLATVLKPISTNQFTIKDCFTFVDWERSHKHNNETMCYFDVCSMFTNVPLHDTIQLVLPNYTLFLILLHYQEQSSKICLRSRRRKATSYSMGNIMTRWMVSRWGLH